MTWRDNLPADTEQFLAERAEAIRTLARKSVFEIGKHLAEVREKCPHGKWLPWLQDEFGWSHTMADKYMAIYAAIRDGKLQPRLQFGLGVTSLALLAAQSTPDEVRDEVSKRAEAGEKITAGQVKKTIAERKTPQETPPPAHKQSKPRQLDLEHDALGKPATTPGSPASAASQSAAAPAVKSPEWRPKPSVGGMARMMLADLSGAIENYSPQEFIDSLDKREVAGVAATAVVVAKWASAVAAIAERSTLPKSLKQEWSAMPPYEEADASIPSAAYRERLLGEITNFNSVGALIDFWRSKRHVRNAMTTDDLEVVRKSYDSKVNELSRANA